MQMTILIVEDHQAIRRSLRSWLEYVFPMCRITEALSGEEAIAIAQDEPPHVVLMDIDRPGMDGIQTTRRIKAAAPTAQIVMLTMYEDSEYRAGAISAGASAYVPKCKLGTELLPTLETLLSNWLEPENGVI